MHTEAVRLLVVDDNPDDVVVLHVVAGTLAPLVVLDVAESGDEAIAVVDRPDALPPAAVILDWHLPGVEAREVITHIRARVDWGSVPIVVCSGEDDPSLDELVRSLGADRYEVKPAGVDGVTTMLQRVLELTSTEPVSAGSGSPRADAVTKFSASTNHRRSS